MIPRIALILLALSLLPAGAQDSSYTWPKYNVRSFLEDYSGATPEDARDFFDRLKHIDLTEDGLLWLTMGGQARARMEGFDDFAFGAPARDDDGFYLLQRYMFHAGLHATEHFRVFAEGKVALSTDRDLVGGRRTLDVDTIALQNAFAELTLPVGTAATAVARVGRQELLFGKQRLISPLDWATTRRTFDAAVGALTVDGLEFNGFYAKPVMVDKYDFNNWVEDIDLWGFYSTVKKPFDVPTNIDAYFLAKHVHPPRMMEVNRYTLGGRAWGGIGETPIQYDVESAAQFGNAGSRDIGAWFVASQLSTTFADVAWSPWLAVGFDIASGDKDPTDGEVNTFDQLAPLGHAYYGYIDIVGRQNAIDFSQSLKVTPVDKLWLKLDGHAMWRNQARDALYNAGGGVVRPGARGTSLSIGYELDFTFKYTFDHHLDIFGGYSHLFAGDFIRQTGTSDDIDFWYLQSTFTF